LLDVIIIGVILLLMYAGYKRGLIHTAYSLVSFVLALILATLLYPSVAAFFRGTMIYTSLQDYFMRSMGLDEVLYTQSLEFIDSLPLPALLRNNLLMHYDSPGAFEALNVNTIEEYVAAFFAGIAINIIAILVVFLIVWIALGVLSKVLDIIGRLPIIRHFNKGGGTILGAVQGLIVVWIGLAVLSLFFLDPTRPEMVVMLDQSLLANIFYQYNPIMSMLATIS